MRNQGYLFQEQQLEKTKRLQSGQWAESFSDLALFQTFPMGTLLFSQRLVILRMEKVMNMPATATILSTVLELEEQK